MGVVTEKTFCRVCHAACPMEIDIVDNEVVAVRGDRDDPLFEGYTCIKGRQLADQHHHPDRLRSPLRRTSDGRFEEVSSEEALDEIAARMQAILADHGPRALASYTGTGGYQCSTSVAVARAWHKGFDSPSFYTSVTIDQPAKATAPLRIGSWEAGFHNFRDADVSMAIGYNPMVSSYGAIGGLQGTNPFVAMRRAKDRGMKLIVVDPRRTELATFADIHLQVRPGEDPTLLAGLINVVMSEGLYDHEFCERYVDQLDALTAAVEPFTVDYVAERCEVPAEDLVAAARMFAAGPRGTVGTGTGTNMSPHPSLSEHLAIALNVLCGRVNKAGEQIESGWFLQPPTPRRAQVVASRHPTNGPPARIRGLRGYRGEMPTNTLAEEIIEPGEGQVRALVVSGGNPVVAWPDHALTMEAMEQLDLLVVIDHRMTATAEMADYVLPPRLSLERADVPHIMDRWFAAPYTNYTPAVLEPDGDVLGEWEVFWGIAKRMGTPIRLPGGDLPTDHRPTDDEVIDLTYATARMPMAEVRANQRTIHEDRALVAEPPADGADARFTVAPDDIVAELAEVRAEESGAEVLAGYDPDQYPYRLVSRRLKNVLNSLGQELPALRAKGTTNHAYMNPDDMAALGVESGDLIDITSPRGSLTGVVDASPDVKPGVVSMAHSWGGRSLTDEKVRDIGAPTNRLVTTQHGYDPITGMAVQSAIPVSVRASELADA